MRLTFKRRLSSTNKPNIWPKSAAFPCEYKTVPFAREFRTYTATISLPLLVFNFSTSTESSSPSAILRRRRAADPDEEDPVGELVISGIERFPVEGSVESV